MTAAICPATGLRRLSGTNAIQAMPDGGDLMAQGMEMLKGKFFA